MATADPTKRYWHFLREDRRLCWGDYREVVAGGTYKAKGKLDLCRNGMHASESALDAVRYAPGAIVCRVVLGGQILTDTDKVCARSRTVLWMVDANRALREFAIWCAEWALSNERKAGRDPDPGSWAAIDGARRRLDGAVTDSEWQTVRAAAWDAHNDQWRKYSAYAAYAAAYAAHAAAYAAAAADAADAYAAAADAAARIQFRNEANAELTRRLLTLAPPEHAE